MRDENDDDDGDVLLSRHVRDSRLFTTKHRCIVAPAVHRCSGARRTTRVLHTSIERNDNWHQLISIVIRRHGSRLETIERQSIERLGRRTKWPWVRARRSPRDFMTWGVSTRPYRRISRTPRCENRCDANDLVVEFREYRQQSADVCLKLYHQMSFVRIIETWIAYTLKYHLTANEKKINHLGIEIFATKVDTLLSCHVFLEGSSLYIFFLFLIFSKLHLVISW